MDLNLIMITIMENNLDKEIQDFIPKFFLDELKEKYSKIYFENEYLKKQIILKDKFILELKKTNLILNINQLI